MGGPAASALARPPLPDIDRAATARCCAEPAWPDAWPTTPCWGRRWR
jgi:hypothetical protein